MSSLEANEKEKRVAKELREKEKEVKKKATSVKEKVENELQVLVVE